MSEKIQLHTEKMVYGGACLARREDGKAVFVPFTLPGELVEVEIVEERKGHARARLLEVLEPSLARIAPECKLYTVCGGCHYQHITYEKQLEFKQQVFTDQLSRLGGIENPPVSSIIPSEQIWRYRSRAQFHQAGDGRLGFLEAASNNVVPVEECHLLTEGIEALSTRIDMEYLPELNRLEIREGDEGSMMVVFQSEDPVPPDMELDIDAAVVHLGPEGPFVMADSMYLEYTVAQKKFKVSAPSFFQVNLSIAKRLVDLIKAKIKLNQEQTIFDVFCGVGLISAFIAGQVGELAGIESSEYACDDFAHNLDRFDNVSLYQDVAANAIGALETRPDTLIVDPPRSGLSRRLRDKIVALAPETIAYVSCDPATLARDCKRLIESGYQLIETTPLDMFPQTYHIESFSILKLKQ